MSLGKRLRRVVIDILDFRDRRSLAPISADELHQDLLLLSFRIVGVVSLRRHRETVVVSCWINLTEFPSPLCVAKISLGGLVELAHGIGLRGWTRKALSTSPLLSSLPPDLKRREQLDDNELVDWLRRPVSIARKEVVFTNAFRRWGSGGRMARLCKQGGGARAKGRLLYCGSVQFAIERSDQVLESSGGSFDVPKICDPACGSGQFLVHCAEALSLRLEHREGCADPASTVIAHSLYGIDLDPVAVENCRFALLERCANPDAVWQLVWEHVRQGDTLTIL